MDGRNGRSDDIGFGGETEECEIEGGRVGFGLCVRVGQVGLKESVLRGITREIRKLT